MLTTKLTSGSIIGTIRQKYSIGMSFLDGPLIDVCLAWPVGGWSTMAWQGLAQKYIKHIGKP